MREDLYQRVEEKEERFSLADIWEWLEEKGRVKGITEVARNMYLKGFSGETIMECTGVPKKTFEEIAASIRCQKGYPDDITREDMIYKQVVAEHGRIGEKSRQELIRRMSDVGVPYRTMFGYVDMMMRHEDIYEEAKAMARSDNAGVHGR